MAVSLLPIHQDTPHRQTLAKAAECLRRGGILLCPTDTGYAFLGSSQEAAIPARFLSIRPGHPKTKPFSLLCKDLSEVAKIALLPSTVYRVAQRAFPGPYTFILEAVKATPRGILGEKRKSVGVRVPAHPVVRALLEDTGCPLLVSSVTDEDELVEGGYFRKESEDTTSWWTSAQEIVSRHKSLIGLALESPEPVPLVVSTVIDFTVNPPRLVRSGGWDLGALGIVVDES